MWYIAFWLTNAWNLAIFQRGKCVSKNVLTKMIKLLPVYMNDSRSSHQGCSMKQGVLRNFTKFTENTCARVSFLIKRLRHRFFLVNFAKFLRIPFSQNTSGQLLLWFIWRLSLYLVKSCKSYIEILCDVLCDLLPFLSFKKRGKHSWRSVTYSKVADFSII